MHHTPAGLLRDGFFCDRVPVARRALAEARADRDARASRIEAPSFRQSFFLGVPEHANLMRYAERWLRPA